MARRALYTLLIAALGAAAFWLGRPQAPDDEGLVVHVYVEDANGEPLKNAQAERLFDPGWKVVNRDGYRKLTHVRLKADTTEPSAEAVGQALRVRAPFYTLRGGFEPTLGQRPDGSWEARYTLHHHGVLRVHVEGTHLGPVKAYLEADEPQRRWEAMDQGNVARPGAPTAFRIYPGIERVVVRVVGEADQHGAIAVATRRYFVKPPGPGHIIEKTLAPDQVQPIVGLIDSPRSGRPPTLRGIARVTELSPGGRRIAHDPVPVDDEGSFVVREVGAGRYEITAALDFFASQEAPVTVEGGGSIDIGGLRPLPWVVLSHEDFDAKGWGGDLEVHPATGARRRAFLGHEESSIALPGPGLWQVRGFVAGTDETQPAALEARVEVDAAGEHQATLQAKPLPHGTLVVKTAKEAWAKRRGGTVSVGKRKRTLLRGLAEEAVFKNLAAGPAHVTLEWNDPKAEAIEANVEVQAGTSTEVTLK